MRILKILSILFKIVVAAKIIVSLYLLVPNFKFIDGIYVLYLLVELLFNLLPYIGIFVIADVLIKHGSKFEFNNDTIDSFITGLSLDEEKSFLYQISEKIKKANSPFRKSNNIRDIQDLMIKYLPKEREQLIYFLKDYYKMNHADFISDINRVSSNFNTIRELNKPFVLHDIIEEEYPHKYKVDIAFDA